MKHLPLPLTILFLLLAALLSQPNTAVARTIPMRPAPAQAVITMSVAVTLPVGTPANDTIYIAGDFQQPSQWDPGANPLARNGRHASGEITVIPGNSVNYKFTRGTWDTVEKGAICEELGNRTTTAVPGNTIEATVANWADICVDPPLDNRVETVDLPSAALGITKRFYVYTPPGYGEATDPLPVLYLFRGHETEWINPYQDGTRGGQNVIDVYQALLAAGDVGPIILVFPGISSEDNSLSGFLTNLLRPDLVDAGDVASVGSGAFETFFLDELIPYVDANYNTIPSKFGRGVDGFSLGGFMSLKIAAKHPDLFRTAGAYDGTFLYADPTCTTIDVSDGLFYNPAYDSLFAPIFDQLPRNGAYAAQNNAANLICNGDADALQSLVWLVQYGPLADEPNVNYLRGEHLMNQLAAKGVANGIAPTVISGGHNWAMADAHMAQTLPLHYAALQPVPTAVTIYPPTHSNTIPYDNWVVLLLALLTVGVAASRRRSVARAAYSPLSR